MYQWIITLVNGERYLVINKFSKLEEFLVYLYGTDSRKKTVSLHELENPEYKDFDNGSIKVSKVAIDSDKIASIEW